MSGVSAQGGGGVSRGQAGVEAQLLRVAERAAASVVRMLEEEDVGWSRVGAGTGEVGAEDLVGVRAKCRRMWAKDPVIGRVARLLAAGSVGAGVGVPRCSSPEVGEVVGRLWRAPRNQASLFGRSALVDLSNAALVEGERFITCHTGVGSADVVLSRIAPDEVVEVVTHPEDQGVRLAYLRKFRVRSWSVGLARWQEETEPVVRYYRDVGAPDPARPDDGDDPVAAGLVAELGVEPGVAVVHAPVNTVGLRGVPEAWRAYEWVRAFHAVLSDMAVLSQSLAMFAWMRQLRTKSQAAVRRSASQFVGVPPGPGAVGVVGEGVDMSPVSVGTGGVSNLQGAARQVYLQGIRAFGFGEHWFSDATTSNLAVASAMELPAMWELRDRQEWYRDVIQAVVRYALRVAWRAGVLSLDPDEGDVGLVDLDFEAVKPRDDGVVAQLLMGLMQAGEGGLVARREASYQAYRAMGSNDVARLLEEQYGSGVVGGVSGGGG